MRKIFTLTFILAIFATATFGQTTVVCEDFNAYAGDSTGHYHGWYLSYNTQFSFYTTVPSSGNSGPNSYKFGVDSATVITPDITGADNISFWMKGNAATGGDLGTSTFYVYESSDSVNWTKLDSITPITPFAAVYMHYALAGGTKYIKFFYDKDLGNVAFDDFCATIGFLNVGVHEISNASLLSAFPNPTNGLFTVNVKGVSNAVITVNNILGSEVKRILVSGNPVYTQVDLSDFPDGVYYIKLKSEGIEKSQKIIVRK
jgi:hypothetical protein